MQWIKWNAIEERCAFADLKNVNMALIVSFMCSRANQFYAFAVVRVSRSGLGSSSALSERSCGLGLDMPKHSAHFIMPPLVRNICGRFLHTLSVEHLVGKGTTKAYSRSLAHANVFLNTAFYTVLQQKKRFLRINMR
jgi:hypothetical protein